MCADETFDFGEGCAEEDVCSAAHPFDWTLFRFFKTLTHQTYTAPSDDSVPVGFCQTEFETGLDTDNFDAWANDTLLETDDDSIALNGLVSADYDVCAYCDGGCDSSGVCPTNSVDSDTNEDNTACTSKLSGAFTIENIANDAVDSFGTELSNALESDIAGAARVDSNLVTVTDMKVSKEVLTVTFEIESCDVTAEDLSIAFESDFLTATNNLDDAVYADASIEVGVGTVTVEEVFDYNSAHSLSLNMYLVMSFIVCITMLM
jgi:hypothetical protein